MRILKLVWSFLKYAAKGELEFRFNVAMFLLFDLLWFTTSLIGVVLVFRQAGTVAGWTQAEAVLLVLVYYVTSSLIKVLVIPGAESLAELVRRGEFDHYLLRPVDPQFLVSIRTLRVHELFRMILAFALLPWYLGVMDIAVTVPQGLLFVAVTVLGAVGLYGAYFAIATLSFWIENLFNVGDLFREMLDVAKRPSDIFTGAASTVATFVIPVGLVATIPTKVILGTIDRPALFWALASSAALFLVSRLLFTAALRRYSSASS